MSNNDPFDARKNGKFSAFSDGPGEPPPFDEEAQEDIVPPPEEEVLDKPAAPPVEDKPKPDPWNEPMGAEMTKNFPWTPVPGESPTADDEMLDKIEALQPSEVEYHKPQLSVEETHGNLRTEGDNYRVLLHQIMPYTRRIRNTDIDQFQSIISDSRIPDPVKEAVGTILNPPKPSTVEDAEALASLEDKARRHAIILLRHQYPEINDVKAKDIIDTGSGVKLQEKLLNYYRIQDATNFLKDQEATIVEDKKDAEEFIKIFPGKDDPEVQEMLKDSLSRARQGLAPRKHLNPAAEQLKNHLYPFMKDVENFDLGAAIESIAQSSLAPRVKQELLADINVPVSPEEEEQAREQAVKYVEQYYGDVEKRYPNYKKDFLESARGDQFVKQIADNNRLKSALSLLKSAQDPEIKRVMTDALWFAEKAAGKPPEYGVQSETPSAKPKETHPLYIDPTSGEAVRKRREEREKGFQESPEGQEDAKAKEQAHLIEMLNPRNKRKVDEARKEEELREKRIENVRGLLKEMEQYSLDPTKTDIDAVSKIVNDADMPDYMKKILNRRLQPLDPDEYAVYITHPTKYRESMLKGLSDAETTVENAYGEKNTRTPKALMRAREFMDNPTPENQARAKQFLDLARIQDVMNIMNNWQLKWTDPALMEFNKIKDIRPDVEPNQPGKKKFPFHAKPLMYRPSDARNTSGLIDPYEMDQKKEKQRLNRKQTFETAGKEAYFETYEVPVRDRAAQAAFFETPEGKRYLTDVTNTLEDDYQKRQAMYQNLPQKKKQELPTEQSQLVNYVGKNFNSMTALRDAARGKGTSDQRDMAQYILKKMNPKDIAALFTKSFNLNLKKQGDTDGPGGADWSYDYTSGDSPTKMPKEKRKQRFPFYNSPGTTTPGEGDQGNMIDNKTQENYFLASVFPRKTKTADNDMFETYLWEGAHERWASQTIFKRAYATFKPGDVVVQYGANAQSYKTFRRRTGSIGAGKLMLHANLLMIAETLVGGPTPDDSLAEGPGGKIMRNTEDSKPGPRDGFERKKPSRQQTMRNILPAMDTPDSEGIGFLPTSASINKDAGALSIIDEIANKWMETAQAAGPDAVLDYFADASGSFRDLVATITNDYGIDADRANQIAKMIMETVPQMIHIKYAAKDVLPGGKGDNKADSDFNPKQIADGVKIEAEHTPNPKIRKEIAKDHLTEMPDYYTKLKQMEKGAAKPNPYAKSVLNQILEPMRTATEDQFAELKQLALDTISQSQINETSKTDMLAAISQQNSLVGLQKYLYNALLAFEGFRALSFRTNAEQMITQSQTPEDQAWKDQPADDSINFQLPPKRKRPTELNETQLMNGEYGDRPRMLLSMKDKKRKTDSEK